MRNFWAQLRDLVNTSGKGHVAHLRQRVTVADINAGLTLLPAKEGIAYRLIDFSFTAIGGSASGATDVRLLGTQGAASVALFIAPIASLVVNVFFAGRTLTTHILTAGGSFVRNDEATAITIGKTGGTLATSTHVDVVMTYAIEYV